MKTVAKIAAKMVLPSNRVAVIVKMLIPLSRVVVGVEKVDSPYCVVVIGKALNLSVNSRRPNPLPVLTLARAPNRPHPPTGRRAPVMRFSPAGARRNRNIRFRLEIAELILGQTFPMPGRSAPKWKDS